MTSPALLPSPLEGNLRTVRARIATAARGAERRPGEVQLLAVTKSVAPPVALALARCGQVDLGESRIDDLETKAAAFAAAEEAPRVRWHFIGHLQRNKARRVVRLAQVIHSVDSPRLATSLEQVAAEEGRRPAVYLQVNFTGEEGKHGLEEAHLGPLLAGLARSPHLEVLGLMAMGPLVEGPGHDAAAVFARVADLARRLEARNPAAFVDRRCRLSMGMSGDLEAAVAAGSTCVRVGGALFEGLEG